MLQNKTAINALIYFRGKISTDNVFLWNNATEPPYQDSDYFVLMHQFLGERERLLVGEKFLVKSYVCKTI